MGQKFIDTCLHLSGNFIPFILLSLAPEYLARRKRQNIHYLIFFTFKCLNVLSTCIYMLHIPVTPSMEEGIRHPVIEVVKGSELACVLRAVYNTLQEQYLISELSLALILGIRYSLFSLIVSSDLLKTHSNSYRRVCRMNNTTVIRNVCFSFILCLK